MTIKLISLLLFPRYLFLAKPSGNFSWLYRAEIFTCKWNVTLKGSLLFNQDEISTCLTNGSFSPGWKSPYNQPLRDILCHGQYLKNLLISKGYLSWGIGLYLILSYFCQVCMVLSKMSCKIERLGMKNRVLSRKSLVNQLYLQPFQWEVQTLFFRELMLIWPIIILFEFFNLKFFNTLFSLFTSFEVFVFRMLLVYIDSQFFVFNNWECVCSIFPYVCRGGSSAAPSWILQQP